VEACAQLSGKYRRQATGRLAVCVVTDKLTATRQFSCLPTEARKLGTP
jgi:hypothetical protein